MTNPHVPIAHRCDLARLFELRSPADHSARLSILEGTRLSSSGGGTFAIKQDVFSNGTATSCFVRSPAGPPCEISFYLGGNYRVTSCASGGWLLLPAGHDDRDMYWVPKPPTLRRVDAYGHVLEERDVQFSEIAISSVEFGLRVSVPCDWGMDWGAWRFTSASRSVIEELRSLLSVEMQGYFLWGSHKTYQRPADVYLSLIHGHVYETRFSWPNYWKICSENDAHAIYTVLTGLELATGKQLYRLLKDQMLLSVLDRQGADGGWRHGEWSDRMESHYRLHCSAMHMLMDALDERDDPALLESLRKAAAFVSKQGDELTVGTWFLHDELERSVAGMNQGPFRWYPSRALGKSATNMLVLNTQLDATIALHRYGKVTGDLQYSDIVDSARKATDAVLRLNSAPALYRALFWAIGLTLLPTPVARALPLPLRAVKRLAWKHIVPRWACIKAAFPRLVMPGGYIDRALSVGALSDAYLSVNAMDLARYLRQFGEKNIQSLISGALRYATGKGLLARWGEDKSKEYALGFWAEALYHLCTIDPLFEYRSMLAQTMLALEIQSLGMPPSLLGANSEAVPKRMQLPCPSTRHGSLRIANLSRAGTMELIVVNPTDTPIPLQWDIPPSNSLRWSVGSLSGPTDARADRVPARGWLWGREEN